MLKHMSLLFATVSLVAGAAHAAKPAAGVEEALKTEITAFNTAWNKGDAKALAAFWTEDGSLINPSGDQAHGRAEVQKVIENDMSTMLKGAHAHLQLESVNMIDPTTVTADCSHEFSGMKSPDGKVIPAMKAHVFAVAVKKGDHWMWQDVRPYFFAPKPSAKM